MATSTPTPSRPGIARSHSDRPSTASSGASDGSLPSAALLSAPRMLPAESMDSVVGAQVQAAHRLAEASTRLATLQSSPPTSSSQLPLRSALRQPHFELDGSTPQSLGVLAPEPPNASGSSLPSGASTPYKAQVAFDLLSEPTRTGGGTGLDYSLTCVRYALPDDLCSSVLRPSSSRHLLPTLQLTHADCASSRPATSARKLVARSSCAPTSPSTPQTCDSFTQLQLTLQALDWLLSAMIEDGDELVVLRIIEPKSDATQKDADEARDAAQAVMDSVIAKSERALSVVVEFVVGPLHTSIQRMVQVRPSMPATVADSCCSIDRTQSSSARAVGPTASGGKPSSARHRDTLSSACRCPRSSFECVFATRATFADPCSVRLSPAPIHR